MIQKSHSWAYIHTKLWLKKIHALQSSWNVKVTQSCPTLQPSGLYTPWDSPGQKTGVDSHSLLQGIFPAQGLNPGLPHCRRILYQLSHQGSPKILECVAHPFSSGFSQPRNRTVVSCTACRFFTTWDTREALAMFIAALFSVGET